MTQDRYHFFRELAQKHQLGAVALVPGSNFCRLFDKNFHQNERPLVLVIPQKGMPSAIVPELELGSFEMIDFEGEVFSWKDQTGYQEAFDKLSAETPFQSLGVEGQNMRVFVHHAFLQANAALNIVDIEKSLSSSRLIKNDTEIATLERAISISENALASTIDRVKVGMTEKQIESLLIQNLFGFGADELSFGPIVAAGDNSARPHAHARADYAVQSGDALLLDFGARLDGLSADITRTFFIKEVSEEGREVYDTVLQANLMGLAAIKPGATAHDVDDAATGYLESSPFADRILTKTGHGLGRDIHEDPYIMRGNQMVLAPGMVFTVEPGLYELDNFGVRIEDDVLVTESGVRSLTGFDKSLTLIG